MNLEGRRDVGSGPMICLANSSESINTRRMSRDSGSKEISLFMLILFEVIFAIIPSFLNLLFTGGRFK